MPTKLNMYIFFESRFPGYKGTYSPTKMDEYLEICQMGGAHFQTKKKHIADFSVWKISKIY